MGRKRWDGDSTGLSSALSSVWNRRGTFVGRDAVAAPVRGRNAGAQGAGDPYGKARRRTGIPG